MKENMKQLIFKFKGGIGNQFFQYAVAYAVAKKHNVALKVNLSLYKNYKFNEKCGFVLNKIIPNLEYTEENPSIKQLSWWEKLINRYPNLFKEYLERKEFFYNRNIYFIRFPLVMSGYFQSYRYFEGVNQEIIELYRKMSLSKEAIKVAKRIEEAKNTVAIHYRDYADPSCGSQETLEYMGYCSKDYYEKAIEITLKKYPEAIFFVFSNNISKAKEVIKLSNKVIFVEYLAENVWEDMKLMSLCSHNIIANSSYSWWASYLNKNPNKLVIAYKKWGNLLLNRKAKELKHFFPKEWILL